MYNGSQTGGEKSLQELQTKHKNLKYNGKKELSQNAREIELTGGGSARIDLSNEFDFSNEQIVGLPNEFDSDSVGHSSNMQREHALRMYKHLRGKFSLFNFQFPNDLETPLTDAKTAKEV